MRFFLPLLSNFAIECATVKVQENKGTEHNINFWYILIMLIYWVKTNFIQESKETDLEVNGKKTKFIFVSLHQTTGQNHYIIIDDKSFENLPKLKCLGTTFTYQTCIHEDVNNRLNSRNLLSNIVRIKITIINIILTFVLVWNEVSYFKGRVQVEGIWEQDSKEKLCT